MDERIDCDQRAAKTLAENAANKIAGAIHESHRFAMNRGRENLGRRREERSPDHVAEEAHAAERDGEQYVARMLERAEHHNERCKTKLSLRMALIACAY
ncbi:hypothetical protein M3I53_07275 [Paraburkholderia sp. CNPSo 3272]|uniref:hypothetical protein n=1 Tax=Paraburkholderia sp. CNPSo 3272 TaxID=2940931 RepID=UPI0020B81B48|nr:hypothetical protein [Paraburkholderia sp. CNPSo 3272]MCP3722931.1 hypothetical protein [Paraburkholderia sp. CNPSo 3272]